MSDEDAFIATIEANATDDLARLVYADWLDERGHAGGAYLRSELALSKLEKKQSYEAKLLRTRLQELRFQIDPTWLARFDQPHLMRANPTPFDPLWIAIDLGEYREREGTYTGYVYNSLPPIHIPPSWEWLTDPSDYHVRKMRELRAYFGSASLQEANSREQKAREAIEDQVRHLSLTLPPAFLSFCLNENYTSRIPSCTDCGFALSSTVVPSPDGDDGHLIGFYHDSQGCCHWYLYLAPSGYHAVVASPHSFDDDETDADKVDPDSDLEVWYCAPSFEAFLYRWWIENSIWFKVLPRDTAEYRDRRPLTPAEQSYLAHYQTGSI